MADITIFPDRLTVMTEDELIALPAAQLHEIDINLAQLVEWVKKAQAKTHNAKKRRYAEHEKAARAEAGKDFGTVHFQDGPIRVTVDTPKRVAWDQKQLAAMAKRIADSGDRIEDYLDIEFTVPEARFTNWPTALREQFAPARTVKPGKASYDLAIDSEE